MEVFKSTKAIKPLMQETMLQILANDNVSNLKYRQRITPKVICIVLGEFKGNILSKKIIKGQNIPPIKDGVKIIMEKMSITLTELCKNRQTSTKLGYVKDKEQYKLLYLALSLDKKGIYHNDSNPLNIMYNDNDNNFYYIDFGMSRLFNKKDDKNRSNINSIYYSFIGGIQGLVTRRICEKPKIIKTYSKKIKEGKFTSCDENEIIVQATT